MPDDERAANHGDGESGPTTDPYTPTFDTGEHPQVDAPAAAPPSTDLSQHAALGDEPIPPPAPPVAVPSRYHYVKWWHLVLVLIAVWIPAAVIGPALFFWWTQDLSPHKTPVVFVTLVYILVCTVGGITLAMVPDRPLLSALAIAVMTALFASGVAAAPFYGTFYCAHTTAPCVMGMIPR
jgi:hypothetical protein